MLDSRLKSNFFQNIKTDNFTVIDATHLSRKNFYFKNLSRFSLFYDWLMFPHLLRLLLKPLLYILMFYILMKKSQKSFITFNFQFKVE